MSRPGTTITRSETRPARSARTNTGALFSVGTTATADVDATPSKPVTSLTEYVNRFGGRTAGNEPMFDNAEFFFKGGGAELFVIRSAGGVDATARAAAHSAALVSFASRDLGPGQVNSPGTQAEPATHLVLMAHADTNNRVALLDGPSSATVATLTAATTVASAASAQERVSGMFGPNITVPGYLGVGTRSMPPSTFVAALLAQRDGAGISPNKPAAGYDGTVADGLDVAFTYADADRTTLNANGFNIFRLMFGDVRLYGFRTLADPSNDSNWLLLSNARLIMAIQALVNEVADRFVFREIDGRGATITEFAGELSGVLMPFWQAGSLYGENPSDAFRVDVGSTVNTPTSIAAGQLKANIGLKMSPFAEEVVIELVKTRITEAI